MGTCPVSIHCATQSGVLAPQCPDEERVYRTNLPLSVQCTLCPVVFSLCVTTEGGRQQEVQWIVHFQQSVSLTLHCHGLCDQYLLHCHCVVYCIVTVHLASQPHIYITCVPLVVFTPRPWLDQSDLSMVHAVYCIVTVWSDAVEACPTQYMCI